MNLFLRAKHWQIFIVIFAIPQIAQVVWMNLIFTDRGNMQLQSEVDAEAFLANIFSYMPWLIALGILISFVQFAWYISVCLGLRKYTPESVRLNKTPFSIALSLVVVYILCMFSGLAYVFQDLENMERWMHPQFILGFVGFSVFGGLAMLYLLYFTAKTYKTAIVKRKVAREEVIGEFFMSWFLFVGIWLMQPKINEMIEGEENPTLAEPESINFNTYSN